MFSGVIAKQTKPIKCIFDCSAVLLLDRSTGCRSIMHAICVCVSVCEHSPFFPFNITLFTSTALFPRALFRIKARENNIYRPQPIKCVFDCLGLLLLNYRTGRKSIMWKLFLPPNFPCLIYHFCLQWFWPQSSQGEIHVCKLVPAYRLPSLQYAKGCYCCFTDSHTHKTKPPEAWL